MHVFATFVFMLSISGCGVGAQEFTGTFAASTADGLIHLTLHETAAGALTGSLILPSGAAFRAIGAVVNGENGDLALEGTLEGPLERGAFLLESPNEDGDYYLIIVPHDASGTPRLNRLAAYFVQRGYALESPGDLLADVDNVVENASPQARAGNWPHGASRDPRLVGVWATQVAMNSAAGTIATQLLMEFRPDGVLIDRGSRAVGSFGDAGLDTGYGGGGGEIVAWQTQQNVLFVSAHGSPWVPLAQFEISGDRLLLSYYDGDRTLWYRQ